MLPSKFIECLQLESNKYNFWIVERLFQGHSLYQVAKEYIERNPYEDVRECSTSGLFGAYVHYKNNMTFNGTDLAYLSGRAGILGQYVNSEDVFMCVTVKELISVFEDDKFDNWMNNNMQTY